MAILHTHRDAVVILDRVRVFVQEDRVVYEQAEGGLNQQWNLPYANIACLLLGNGSSITTHAAYLLSRQRVIVGMTAGGGLPIFYGSLSEYRPTEYLQKWIGFWPDEAKRLFAAKTMAQMRCDFIDECITHGPLSATYDVLDGITSTFRGQINSVLSIASLLACEANFAKTMYMEYAKIVEVLWQGRDTTPRAKTTKKKDSTNTFLDRGNYIAYGCASIVLWCLGIPPSLPVTHGASRAGGLVFDLADIIKDGIVLARALYSAAENVSEQDFRRSLLADFNQMKVVPRLFSAIHEIVELMD